MKDKSLEDRLDEERHRTGKCPAQGIIQALARDTQDMAIVRYCSLQDIWCPYQNQNDGSLYIPSETPNHHPEMYRLCLYRGPKL